MSIRRLSVLAAAGMSVGPLVSNSARADAPTPAGLNVGDHFRLVFVTNGTTNVASTDISTYDSFVSTEANNAGLGTYNGSAVTWQTLGSTEGGVSAISRFNPTTPIYKLDGTKVADSGTDLWDDSIASAIDVSSTGATVSGVSVWTGTNSNGSEAKGLGGEGGLTTFGVLATDGTWTSSNTAGTGDSHNLYAFSNDLTVVPEPAAAGMIALGAVLTTTRRSTRRGVRRR